MFSYWSPLNPSRLRSRSQYFLKASLLRGWPDYRPDQNTAYGYEDVEVKPPIPSPAAIQRMEEVLDWLQLVPVEYRRLLWFRAEGWSWRKLGRYFGCGSRQVRLRWRDGVVGLWEGLR